MSFEVIEELKQDLQKRARSRLLMQFKDSVVLRKVLEALVKEVQTFSDAVADVMYFRTPAQAFGEQLDGVGRIVGQAREGFTYDENIWFAPDIVGQNVDAAFAWVPGGYLLGTYLPDDETYRRLIEAKVFRNFSRYGSVEEIQTMFNAAFGFPINFVRTDMMEVDVVVPEGLPDYALGVIVNFQNTAKVDQRGLLPWPATLSIRNVLSAATEVVVDEATFTRASSAYLSDGTPVSNDEPRFESGGVLLEEGTTNLLSNNEASADTDLTGWAGVFCTLARTTDEAFVGTHSVRCTSTVNGEFGVFCPSEIPASEGQVFSAQARIKKGTTNASARVRLEFNQAGGGILSASDNEYETLVDDEWILSKATATAPANTAYVVITAYTDATGQIGDTFYVDARMVEQKAYTTSFQLGTREPELLVSPINMWTQQGTIETRITIPDQLRDADLVVGNPGTWQGRIWLPFKLAKDTGFNQHQLVYFYTSENYFSAAIPVDKLGVEIAMAFTWDNVEGKKKIFIDGVLLAEGFMNSTEAFYPDSLNITIGKHLNGIVSEFKFCNKAKKASELSVSSPFKVDKDTIALMHLDDLNLVGPLQKYHHLLP